MKFNVSNSAMALKWKELDSILSEAKPLLEGSVLQKVGQSGDFAAGEAFSFTGFSQTRGPWHFFVSLAKELTCACLLPADLKLDKAPVPETFVMVMRKHLLGKEILKVEQVEKERFFFLHFEEGYSLFFELLPRAGNILLFESWNAEERLGKVLGSFRTVSLEPGAIYRLPPPPAQPMEQRREFSDGTKFSYNTGVARHYWALLQNSEFQQWKREWRQAVKSALKKMRSAEENTAEDLRQAAEAELFQKRGMVLVAHLYELGPKQLPKSKLLILDDLEIPLDLARNYAENAELLFKKAKKFTRAVGELEERLADLREKVAALEALTALVEAAENGETLELLTREFERFAIPVPEKHAAEKVDQQAKPYLEMLSSDGFTILCGRNQEENRRVTFQESRGNDLWMHAKGLPGAHVVVKYQNKKTIPLNTLLEAAQLVLYHSKIRKGKRAEVDYTQRKHVRAIKGTLAEVTYTGNKTLYVEADPEILKRVLRG